MSSKDGPERDYQFDVSVIMGSKPYNGGRADWLRPQRWSSMLAAYWERRSTQQGWNRWIDSVKTRWPVAFSHKSALLRKTNGTHAYEYGEEFVASVDAPSWIQARKYVDACIKPLLAEHYTIHPSERDGGISKVSEELARFGENTQNAGVDYEPSYPEIQFGASGRDETIGIVRLDISRSQVKAIISQAREAIQNETPGLFSPRIPLHSESISEQLTEATERIRNGKERFASIDLTGDDEESHDPTASLVFVLSNSGARRLGNAIEVINEPESDADSEAASTATDPTLVHPELVRSHTQRLIEIASVALETDGRGVVGSIPDNDDISLDLDWVQEHAPPDSAIEVLGFRATLGEETEDSTQEPVFPIDASEDSSRDDDEQNQSGKSGSSHENSEQNQEQDPKQEQSQQEQEQKLKQSHYRISVELATEEVLSERFNASYVNDVPANSFKKDRGGLHIPNPEISLFLDVVLNPSREETLRRNLEKIDVTDETAEIAVLKAPVEPDSIHQELVIEVFPHFKLVSLRDELRPLIADAGGSIRTEELPYFVKYGTQTPYYITHDISSLTNPERKLTDEESYYNERRIELMHTNTDYRRIVGAEKLTLSLNEIETGAEA